MVYKRERERVKSEVSGLWFTDSAYLALGEPSKKKAKT